MCNRISPSLPDDILVRHLNHEPAWSLLSTRVVVRRTPISGQPRAPIRPGHIIGTPTRSAENAVQRHVRSEVPAISRAHVNW